MGKKKSRDFEPINIQARERDRKRDEQMRARALQFRPSEQQMAADDRARAAAKAARAARLQRQQAEQRVAKGPNLKPPPAARDPLAGRTVDAGTRSLREGLLSFMREFRGGGGSRITGR